MDKEFDGKSCDPLEVGKKEVPLALDVLMRRANTLLDSAQMLADKLNPVLSEENKNEGEECEEKTRGSLCDIAGVIRDRAEVVERVNNILASLISRLEI